MRLAPKLVLAFSLVAVAITIGLGAYVRSDRHAAETERFDAEVNRACDNVASELRRQAEFDDHLIHGACDSGELVDRVAIAIQRNDLAASRLGFTELVPRERVAFDLDELLLATSDGDVIGADPSRLAGTPPATLARMLKDDSRGYSIRVTRPQAIMSRCSKSGTRTVGFIGAHYTDPLLEHLGKTLDVRVNPEKISSDEAHAECTFSDARGQKLPLVVTKSKKELATNLEKIDRAVLLSALAALGAAVILGVILARGLGGPLSELSRQARKVATDEAAPITIKSGGEVGELVSSFNRMIEDLAVTQRRLAAASRVAAWREVARRVAHEVKNPLAPIRAAVETLRRLRARNDPAFDEYFDEATRTVLEEVHRISNIVTEFTRFARLPSPKPEIIELADVAKHVVTMHKPNAGATSLTLQMRGTIPSVNADRDQIIQVLTNLVQNAIDAVRNTPHAEVSIVVAHEGAKSGAASADDRVTISVNDNGPGIAPEFAARLFEPYATTKAHGTGLGLAIAQRIAMEHGGELVYAGKNGTRGAIFRLTLTVEGPPPVSDSTGAESPRSG